jgi:tetratricopeptide (TPR) repeat protein
MVLDAQARRSFDEMGYLRQLAYEEGGRLYAMALEALDLVEDPDPKVRCELLLALGEMQVRSGDTARAKETFAGAAEIARSAELPEHTARAALGYGGRFVWARAGGDPLVSRLLRDALDALGEEDSVLKVRVMARLSGTLRDDPAREPRWTISSAALDMARRLGDPATLAYALEARFAAIWEPATLDERLDLTDEMATVAAATGDPERAIQGHGYRAHIMAERGDLVDASVALEAEGVLAEELGQPAWRWLAAAGRAMLALLQGRYEEADRLITDALHLGERAHPMDAAVAHRIQTFVLLRDRGRVEEVEAVIRRSVEQYPWYPMFRCVLALLYAETGRPEPSAELAEALIAEDVALPVDTQWLFGVSLLAEAIAVLGDERRAAVLYRLILPHAHHNVYAPPDISLGSAHRYLGILALAQGKGAEAERHLRQAIEANDAMGAAPWGARCRLDLARALLARDARGGEEEAAALVSEAAAAARKLGMPMVASHAEAMQAEAGLAGAEQAANRATQPAAFRLLGDSWEIAYGGEMLLLRDSRGLRYLRELLAHPGREIHVAELAASVIGTQRSGPTGAEAELGVDSGHAGEQLDERARQAYVRRIEDLREDLEEAEGWADTERAARAREELDFLEAELASAFGLGGRPRRGADTAERVRKAVTNRIRDALSRISKAHPSLGRHLANAVTTGTFCSYTPEERVDWSLRPP